MAALALGALSSLGIGGLAGTAGAIAGGSAIAGGALGAGALAAGAGIAGGATAIALNSNVLNILSGVATAASVLGTLNSGVEDARQKNELAAEADLEEGQTQLQGLESQNQLRRELFKVLGENRTAVAAAGIDVGSGISESQDASATREATRSLSIERRDDDLRRAMLRARAQGYRRSAGSAIGGALVRAIGQGASYGIDLVNRG